MSNIKEKKIRGRPSVKKNIVIEEVENIVETEEKCNVELIIDHHIQETDNFLDELNNINYGKVQEESINTFEYEEFDDQDEDVLEQEPDEASYNLINKLNSRREQPQMIKLERKEYKTIDEEEDLYSKKGTQILGESKLLLINKITQYKQLFKDQLKGFKIKKNATEEELAAYLEEINIIVSIGSIDTFIIDSILSSIKMCEGLSCYTKYDITGLADILKTNPQFNNLVKILYLKYGVFSAIPPESQLLFLVATSTYICVQTNKKKKMDNFLNAPMGQTTTI